MVVYEGTYQGRDGDKYTNSVAPAPCVEGVRKEARNDSPWDSYAAFSQPETDRAGNA